MTAKPKRRWFQFSLLALFTVITLVAATLGGRIECLRRCAVFHEREAEKLSEEIDFLVETEDKKVRLSLVDESSDPFLRKAEALFRHEKSAELFRKAMYRPWTIVVVPEGVDRS